MKPVFVAIALAGASPLPAQAPAPPPAAAERPIVIGASRRIRSAVLGEEREINIRLPAGYAEGRQSYPVMFLLDGAQDQDFGHIAGLAQLGELSGTYGPFVLVGVQTRSRRTELTSPPGDPRYRRAFPEAGGAERFRRFLSEEVLPFVAARYRTNGRRAIMGESLAGLFVVETFLQSPALFDDYVAISPSLWWDDRAPVRRAPELLRRQALPGRRLFLAIADEGGTMQSGMDLLRAALAAARAPGFEWRYLDRGATETHLTIYHGAALEALRWLYRAPPYDFGPTPWYMIEGAEPPSRPGS